MRLGTYEVKYMKYMEYNAVEEEEGRIDVGVGLSGLSERSIDVKRRFTKYSVQSTVPEKRATPTLVCPCLPLFL